MWQQKLMKADSPLVNVIDHLKVCHRNLFPNVFKILTIFAVLPVTNCNLERSFSKLKLVKRVDRSTMDE